MPEGASTRERKQAAHGASSRSCPAPSRWFEIQHPEQVAGMVLIDPATAPAIEAAVAAAPVETLADYDHDLRAVEGIDRESYLKGFSSLRASGQTLGERPLMLLIAGRPKRPSRRGRR